MVVSTQANELSLSDTLSTAGNDVPTLLKGHDHKAIANFLNQHHSYEYFSKLKSVSTELQLDSIVVSEWSDELQRTEKSLMYTCQFENDGQSVLVSIYKWETTDSEWVIHDENYYEFDEEYRIVQIEFQEHINAEYRLYMRIDYEYVNDLLKFESRYDRIDEMEGWDELEQFEYHYNDNNSLKTVDKNEWDTYFDEWATFAYRTFAYDSIGNLTTEVGFDYDYYDNISKKKFELKYAYDTSSNLTEIVEYVPGWEAGVFAPERKQENFYTTSSELLSEIFYSYSYDADDWVGQVKRIYADEKDGDKIYDVSSYLWDDEMHEWVGSQRMEFLSENNYYNSDIQNWEFLEVYMSAFSFDEVVCDRIESSSWVENEWIYSGNTNYYFSDGILVGIDDLAETKFKIYPNPVVDKLTIESDNFEETICILRDLNGRVILQTTFHNSEQLNLSYLKSGIYIVEVSTKEGGAFVHKMIKR